MSSYLTRQQSFRLKLHLHLDHCRGFQSWVTRFQLFSRPTCRIRGQLRFLLLRRLPCPQKSIFHSSKSKFRFLVTRNLRARTLHAHPSRRWYGRLLLRSYTLGARRLVRDILKMLENAGLVNIDCSSRSADTVLYSSTSNLE
jgi:hypothetical protein